jgi:NAD(P)-dependent dehydrogenase (short-subunit alcohol dehydrogenase family)
VPLAAVTRSLAIEHASRGVRVNAVSLGEISDVVDGILYLERATFVTDEVLHIDGGQVAGH